MQTEQFDLSREKEPVFALDIGTRSIIGVVGKNIDGLFHIEATEMREHPQRAMLDGQIEDIAAVAAVANEVKKALEGVIGRTLTKVCVAAAGRALQTASAAFEMEIMGEASISEEFVTQLELGAVSAAAKEISNDDRGQELFCVGHSVVRYLVDDYVYSNIIDHKGKVAKVEIIATFLPSAVVTSLEAAMQKINLSIDFLTLEPIAAMNAVIPKELRLLNLALVDIGAGTSDIALCDDGSVCAYTMATIAGDEVTETIIRHFLVDFETAERIKHEAASGAQEIAYCDIMGFEYTQPIESVIKAIGPALGELSDTICEKIMEINGKIPAAVFLVGGGSKTPLLCQLVAKRLGLDERKVAVGGNNFMKKVFVGKDVTYGPEFATPLGIAITASENNSRLGFDIEVNGERKQLLRTGSLSLMDVLLLCGYNYADIMGKNGQSISYELNGKKRTARGGLLRPATLILNGSSVGISAKVSSGDVLQVAQAQSGDDAAFRVRDVFLQEQELEILFNGEKLMAGNMIIANGDKVGYEYMIKNGDIIETIKITTLAEFLAFKEIDAQGASFFINGSLASLTTQLIAGDIITEMPQPTGDKPSLSQANVPLEPIIVEDQTGDAREEDVIKKKEHEALQEKETSIVKGPPIAITINGHSVNLPPKKDGSQYAFLDMLTLVEIDPAKPQGDIVLLLNGSTVSFLEPIKSGDNVDIYWKKR